MRGGGLAHRRGAAKALFVSITASTRNIGAFVVYGLAWLGADLMMSALLGALVGLLGLGAIGMVLVLPAVLLFSAGFHVSMQASVDGWHRVRGLIRERASSSTRPPP